MSSPTREQIAAATITANGMVVYSDGTSRSLGILASAYREAIEALREQHDIWPDIDHAANAPHCKACAVLAKTPMEESR